MSTTDLILLMGIATGNIILIINAWQGKVGRREVAALAVKTAEDVSAIVTRRSDVHDQKLDEIHEATNGGVQALRDEVRRVTDLLAIAVADLKAERAK
jgi:sensor histidine kinase regulating citrate/malate metabolism